VLVIQLLFHLPPLFGLSTTTPTEIHSTTPVTQKKTAFTSKTMCRILTTRVQSG